MNRQRLRIVTFNIAHGRGLRPLQGMASARRIRTNLLRIARLLHEVEADVVALQEIDQASLWAGNFDHGAYLGRHSGLPHTAWGINNHRVGLFNLSYGNAVLSRFPLLATENVVFGRRRVGEKGFLYTEIDVHGKVIPFVNLHLNYRSREQRLGQLHRLTDWLTRMHDAHGDRWHIPPIVCGDFNNSRTVSDATASLLSHLHDFADYICFPQGEKTFPSPWPSRSLDFIFLPSKCHRAHAVVIKSFLSDHRPVLVEFDL